MVHGYYLVLTYTRGWVAGIRRHDMTSDMGFDGNLQSETFWRRAVDDVTPEKREGEAPFSQRNIREGSEKGKETRAESHLSVRCALSKACCDIDEERLKNIRLAALGAKF